MAKQTSDAKQQGIPIKNAQQVLGDCLMILDVFNKMNNKYDLKRKK